MMPSKLQTTSNETKGPGMAVLAAISVLLTVALLPSALGGTTGAPSTLANATPPTSDIHNMPTRFEPSAAQTPMSEESIGRDGYALKCAWPRITWRPSNYLP